MKNAKSNALRFCLILVAAAASTGAASKPDVQEATIDQVKSCKPLGQIIGESRMCIKSHAEKSALEQAAALGATHIIWLQVHCVPFAGERATARIFDCAPSVSLDDVFEDYLASNPKLASQTINAQGTPRIPRIMTSKDLDADAADLHGRGYVLVGYAGVSGGKVPLETVRKKAVSVGAEIALVKSRGAGEDIEYQAITNYSRGGTGIAFSSGYAGGTLGGRPVGIAGTGTSIVTSPGNTQTQMVPFSQRRFDSQVLFWRKMKPGPLGLFLDLIPAELRARLSRNTGAYVLAVEDETPAFFANILSGDIIIAVNGTEVRTPGELAALVERRGTSPLKLRILRGEATLEVEIKN